MSTIGYSQEEKSEIKSRKFALGFAPYYTITNGFRLDFDFRINKEKPYWMILSPQFYYHENNNNFQEYIEMKGFGLDAHFRIYLSEKSKPKGPHFSPGFTFQYFNVKDEIFQPVEFTQNGQTYFTMEESIENSNIFKLGPNVLIGYQFLINDVMYLDLYGGISFRLSFDNRSDDLKNSYQDWWGDLGYSGILLNGGMRIGIVF